MKKAYAYTRVSTVMQVDKYSLEAQICTIRNFCDTHDIEIIGEYQDAGKSGTSTDGRDEFKKMIEDCKCNDVDIVCGGITIIRITHANQNFFNGNSNLAKP